METAKENMENFVLSKNATIQDALTAITNNIRGAVVVVDDEGLLEGVVSDGDIRRALVAGATTITPIEKIVNRNPLVIESSKDATEERVKELLDHNRQVHVIPVLEENKVVDIVVRDTEAENSGS